MVPPKMFDIRQHPRSLWFRGCCRQILLSEVINFYLLDFLTIELQPAHLSDFEHGMVDKLIYQKYE